ncbi:HNH endonuclease [Puia sp. P3]|uniref:HNH endonuclease n=1 Tax=Puia sp. P3 TaxID=3423952 RepID=UPI003D67066A
MHGLNEKFYFPEEYAMEAELFFRAYEVESWASCPSEKIRKADRVPKVERMCRFCGKPYGEVTFNSEPHVFPELLGNKFLVSDSECDTCNFIFGKYEDQLSKYLGMSRTMMLTKGKEKMPTFKDSTIRVESRRAADGGGEVAAKRPFGSASFIYDQVTGLFTLKGKKQPYIAYSVYKAFAKMAFSCLHEEFTPEYRLGLEFIRGTAFEEEGRAFAHILRYKFPYTYGFERPTGYIFRARYPDMDVFSRVFMLFTLNTIYIMAVPFGLNDIAVPDRELSLPHPPPLFDRAYHFPTDEIRKERLDFSSSTVVENEEDSFSINLAPGEKIAAIFHHPETGEVFQGKWM